MTRHVSACGSEFNIESHQDAGLHPEAELHPEACLHPEVWLHPEADSHPEVNAFELADSLDFRKLKFIHQQAQEPDCTMYVNVTYFSEVCCAE